MLKVAVPGCTGRMGQEVIKAVLAHPKFKLVAATSRADNAHIGKDVGLTVGQDPCGVLIEDYLEKSISKADVVIDFTLPEACLNHVDVSVRAGKKHIVATTGFSEAQMAQLKQASLDIPLLFAPSLSPGINVLLKLIQQVAKFYGDEADVEVIEMHHRHKVDAPSGIARKIGQTLADTLDRDLEKDAVYGREGITGERDPKTIGFSTIRGGDIIGEHTVLFASEGERLELTHKVTSRATFAKGALKAALWLQSQEVGFYETADVFGLL